MDYGKGRAARVPDTDWHLTDLETALGLRGALRARLAGQFTGDRYSAIESVNYRYGTTFMWAADALAFMDVQVERERVRALERANRYRTSEVPA